LGPIVTVFANARKNYKQFLIFAKLLCGEKAKQAFAEFRCEREASGTSGMKAALNGEPRFRVLDDW